MCTGLEIAALATAGATVAGTGVAVAGQIQQAKAEKEVADYNAEVLESQAKAVEKKTTFDEDLHRDRVRKILSSQRAQYGSRGIDITGTPLLVQLDTAERGELDALAIRYGGDVEAALTRSQANLVKMGGRNRRVASYYGAGRTLLSGASSLAGTYSDYEQTKAFRGL